MEIFNWQYKKLPNLKYKYIDVLSGQKYEKKQEIKDNTGLSFYDMDKCLKENKIVVKNNVEYLIQKITA